MKNQAICILTFSLSAFMSPAKSNDETPLPLGASDLLTDERFDQYRPEKTKIDPIQWTWNAESVELIYGEKDSTFGEFTLADQWAVAELQIENQELKERVSELESRLSKLEGLLSSQKRTHSR